MANFKLAIAKAAHVLGGVNQNRDTANRLQSAMKGAFARNKLIKLNTHTLASLCFQNVVRSRLTQNRTNVLTLERREPLAA